MYKKAKSLRPKLCFNGKKVEYVAGMANIQTNERIEWLGTLVENDEVNLCKENLQSWYREGKHKTTIADETKFCDASTLQNVLEAKSMLDKASRPAMNKARRDSNPFEVIGNSIFINRAAVKLANLDSMMNFHLTKPKDENGQPLVQGEDDLYFADICAGPGGFTEYMLWRKQTQVKGFGFTLRRQNDFDLKSFKAATTEAFKTFYGSDNDGDITKTKNIKSLYTFVLNQTNKQGVHLLMADGAFDVKDPNMQEVEMKQLILCECVVALALVKEGGTCVVKLFDVFTPFTAALVYLMHKCFKEIAIVKPDASRPANSERYFIGKYKKPNTTTIRNHLMKVNEQMLINNEHVDILELVDYEVMKADKRFFKFLCDSNNAIGAGQVASLTKMAAFYNENKIPDKEKEKMMLTFCLSKWDLPNQIPTKVVWRGQFAESERSRLPSATEEPLDVRLNEDNNYENDTPNQVSHNNVKEMTQLTIPTYNRKEIPQVLRQPFQVPSMQGENTEKVKKRYALQSLPMFDSQSDSVPTESVQTGTESGSAQNDIEIVVPQPLDVNAAVMSKSRTDNSRKRMSTGSTEELNVMEDRVFQPKVKMEKLTNNQMVHLQTTEKLSVYPSHPPQMQLRGRLTRSITVAQAYNDRDKDQNELIGMECNWMNVRNTEQSADYEVSQFEMFCKACEKCKLPAPLPFDSFEKMDWNYVSLCDDERLLPGYKLKTVQELSVIPRRHENFPFCHPGPVRDEHHKTDSWYYADSIVQELKFIRRSETFYVVRWIGYDDTYNTLEPESCLRGRAILILFQRKDIYTASQANGPLLLRPSKHNVYESETTHISMKTVSHNSCYGQAMALLDYYLKVEEDAQRYMPQIGFYSSESVQAALKHQLHFTENVFMNLLKDLKRSDYYVCDDYLGSVFADMRDKELLKEFKNLAFNNKNTVRGMISSGLKNAAFASFFVMTRKAGNQKTSDKHLNLHMAVYSIRSVDNTKDSIYFDPAPPCHSKTVPDFLLKLRQPQLRSATRICGVESEGSDCFYQCLKHIIQLQTNEIQFQPDLNSKYFVVKK